MSLGREEVELTKKNTKSQTGDVVDGGGVPFMNGAFCKWGTTLPQYTELVRVIITIEFSHSKT